MTQQMILILAKRVELHPDFKAILMADWRAKFALLKNPHEVMARARTRLDDGFEMAESVLGAKEEIKGEAVRHFCSCFWTEYQIACVQKTKISKGKSTSPATRSNTPQP